MVTVINKEGNKYLARFPSVIATIKMHLKAENKDEIHDQET